MSDLKNGAGCSPTRNAQSIPEHFVAMRRNAETYPEDDYTRGVYNGAAIILALINGSTPDLLYKIYAEKGIETFIGYQQRSMKTAVYPNRGNIGGLTYTALGVGGEAGEFSDQVKKILRDDGGNLTAERLNKCVKELGDTLWYISAATTELNSLAVKNGLGYVDLQDIARVNIEKLEDRQSRNVIKGDGGLR